MRILSRRRGHPDGDQDRDPNADRDRDRGAGQLPGDLVGGQLVERRLPARLHRSQPWHDGHLRLERQLLLAGHAGHHADLEASATQSGAAVSVTNASYDGSLAAGGSTTFGLLGSGTAPTSLGSVQCTAH